MAKKEKKDLDFPKSVTIQELYKWFIDRKLDAIYPNINLIFKIRYVCVCRQKIVLRKGALAD